MFHGTNARQVQARCVARVMLLFKLIGFDAGLAVVPVDKSGFFHHLSCSAMGRVPFRHPWIRGAAATGLLILRETLKHDPQSWSVASLVLCTSVHGAVPWKTNACPPMWSDLPERLPAVDSVQ